MSGSIKKVVVLIVVAAVAGGIGFYIGQRTAHSADENCFGQGIFIGHTAGCPLHYPQNPGGYTPIDEPVIYLYPTATEPVNVRVIYPAGFSYTDPQYSTQTGWNVLATPNGTLTNLNDGQQYPNLIWEGNPPPIKYDLSTGFVVPGLQTAAFLHHELPLIGLSPAETNAFIAYWQPKMSANKYNLIHFAGKEYTDYAKLNITPRPDSTLRVLMAYKPLSQPISVQPQTFSPFQRKGFTVVEWGGTQL